MPYFQGIAVHQVYRDKHLWDNLEAQAKWKALLKLARAHSNEYILQKLALKNEFFMYNKHN